MKSLRVGNRLMRRQNYVYGDVIVLEKKLTEAVVVAYGRSAFTRARKGALKNTHPVDVGGQVLKGLLKRVPQLDPMDISDVILACAKPEGKQSYNMGRQVALKAGLPYDVPAQTINRFCSSGLQAIHTAANLIRTGDADVVIAGGVEMMSTFAMGAKPETQCPSLIEHESKVYINMLETAENVAEKYHITRVEQDQMAVESHAKAARAIADGKFNNQIIPIMALDDDGQWVEVKNDEGVRPETTLESLAKLKPVWKEDGTVTAGTSSQLTDAAAFMILMSREKAEKLGIKPLGRFEACAVAGLDPKFMGEGPIHAVPKVMEKTGLKVSDMDVIEINEAFAAQAVPCIRELGMDPAKVNPYGGAMAMGHPMGATGIFMTMKALDYLERNNGRYALITMCIGGGMGMAGVFERI